MLAAALAKFFLVEMKRWEQLLRYAAAILLIAPGLTVTLIGLAMCVPMFVRQIAQWRRGPQNRPMPI